MPADAPLLLLYPTSPVHVRDLQAVTKRLPGWRCQAIIYQPLSRVSPGIAAAVDGQGLVAITLDHDSDLDARLPSEAAALLLGAVFESFALELFAWAKLRRIPVVAIEEVAQLALNQFDINNYDAPFDRLFVASPDELQRFLALGYPRAMLRLSGLLAYDRVSLPPTGDSDAMLPRLGIDNRRKPIVYTTSPLRNRLAIHNKDEPAFRQAILKQLAIASRQTGRRVLVKLHPNEDLEATKGLIGSIIPDAIVLGREVGMDGLFAAAGVLVNRGNSQTCLESALRGVPTVVAACGLATLFHEAGGAYVVDSVDALPDAIERALAAGPVDTVKLKARHFFAAPQGVAQSISNELADLIATPPVANEADWNWLLKTVLFIGGHDRAARLARRLEFGSAWQQALGAALQAHLDGRRDDAIERWRECIALDRNWFFPHYELAHAYLAKGDNALAIEHANQAIELHPPFHGLWHEIPMRVILMTAYRSRGALDLAAAELNRLDARSLTAVVPELQIEKAAQLGVRGCRGPAFSCLETAFQLLAHCPVNALFDADLRVRALAQLDKLVADCDQAKAYPCAERCYRLMANHRPLETWERFALARAQLAQGQLGAAAQTLRQIAEIPHATRELVERALTPRDSLVLVPHWATLSTRRLAALKLMVLALYAGVRALQRTGYREWENPATALLLVFLFARSGGGRYA